MVKKLEWIEMAQLATIPVSCGEGKDKKERERNHCWERLGGLLKSC
jgi:hypothetical protein